MKKILLCTTALISLAAVSAIAAEEQKKVEVSLGGSSTFETGIVKQDRNHKAPISFSPNQKTKAVYSKSKVALKAEGHGDNNMVYGAIVRLQVAANQANGFGDKMDRSYIYNDTDAGSVQLGSNASASALMAVDAGTIASATGGAAQGDWSVFSNVNALGHQADRSSTAYALVGSLTTLDSTSKFNDLDNKESARGISYFSPRISGFQIGLSYKPDLANAGDGVNTNTYLGSTLKIKDVISTGLSYMNSFNDVNVNLSATADRGKVNKWDNATGMPATIQRHDLKSYNFGAVVGTNGFSAAVSYGKDGKSLAPKARNFSSDWWTAGLAYENGPMTTSLTYLTGKKGNKNERSTNGSPLPLVTTKALSLGADYEVAPGFTPFAEVTMVKLKAKNLSTSGYADDGKNKATVFIIGSKIKF